MMIPLLCVLAFLPLQDPSERDLREWISRLNDDNPERRNESYRKLKEQRARSLPQLKKAAEEGDRETRAHAARLVSVIGVMEQLPPSLLQAKPGIEERLAPGGGKSWAEAFIQLPSDDGTQRCKDADLTLLAREAAKAAETPEDRKAFLTAARSLKNRSAAQGLLEIARGKHWDAREEAVGVLEELEARAELLEVARPPNQMPENARKGERREDFEASQYYVHSLNLGYRAFSALRSLGAVAEFRAMLKDGNVRGFPADAAGVLAEMGVREAIPDMVALLPQLQGHEVYKLARTLGDIEATQAVPQIAKLLEDPTGAPRAGALYALGRLGSRNHVPAMIAHLLDKRSAVKVAAAEALGTIAAPEARQPLLDALKDSDPTMRAITALALGRIDGDGVVDALSARLEDDEVVVRVHAAIALARRGSRKGAALLLRFAEKPSPLNLSIQCEGFAGGYQSMINPLMELNALASPEAWKRAGAARLSKDTTGITGPDLEQFARDLSLTLELSAALTEGGKALAESRYYFSAMRKGLPLLQALERFCLSRQLHSFVVDGDRLKVLTTAEALQFWKRWYVETAKGNPAEKEDAARFAEELRRAAMAPEARKSLEDKEATDARRKHRAERAQALGELLSAGIQAIPGAEDALLDGNDHAWTELLLKTKAGSAPKGKDLDNLAVQGLRAAGTAEEKKKAAEAVSLLKAVGAVGELIGLLSEPEPQVLCAVLLALGSTASERDIPRILAAARNSNPGVRMSAATALQQLNSKECWPIFLELTRHPDYGVREPAVWRVCSHGGPEFIPDMIPMLKYATNFSNAAQAATFYLSRHGAREAIPELILVFEAKESRCAREAQQALVQLGAREAIPAFLRKFREGNSEPAPILAAWGVKEILPELRSRLQAKEVRGLGDVIRALAEFSDRESVPTLEELLADDQRYVRPEAALALARIQGPKARAKILAAKNEQGELDPALAAVGAREAIPAMIARLDKWCRDGTITALMDLGAAEALPRIFETLKTPDNSYNYTNALRAVYRAYPRESLPTCRIYLEKCTSYNGDLAAGYLCESGSREAVGLLLENAASRTWPLNALRNRTAWERLSKAKRAGTFTASLREIAAEAAREAGLEFVDLPESAKHYKAWSNVHITVGRPFRETPLVDWLDALQDKGWGLVLEGMTLKVLPRDEAAKLWRDWWEVEKSR